jgi:hypothetical protein
MNFVFLLIDHYNNPNFVSLGLLFLVKNNFKYILYKRGALQGNYSLSIYQLKAFF